MRWKADATVRPKQTAVALSIGIAVAIAACAMTSPATDMSTESSPTPDQLRAEGTRVLNLVQSVEGASWSEPD